MFTFAYADIQILRNLVGPKACKVRRCRYIHIVAASFVYVFYTDLPSHTRMLPRNQMCIPWRILTQAIVFVLMSILVIAVLALVISQLDSVSTTLMPTTRMYGYMIQCM